MQIYVIYEYTFTIIFVYAFVDQHESERENVKKPIL